MKAAMILAPYLISASAYAAVPLEGWYGGVFFGPTYSPVLHFSIPHPLLGISVPSELTYRSSLDVGGQVGFRYDKFRYEGELLFNQNNYKSLQMGSMLINSRPNRLGLLNAGNTRFFAGLINIFYEIYPDAVEIKIAPYLGLGVGYTNISNSLSVNYFHRELYSRNDSVSAPIGQAMAGLNYFFTDRCSLGLDFRYLTTPHHEALNSRIALETINLVGNFSFG